jgi:hypothetical protein
MSLGGSGGGELDARVEAKSMGPYLILAIFLLAFDQEAEGLPVPRTTPATELDYLTVVAVAIIMMIQSGGGPYMG